MATPKSSKRSYSDSESDTETQQSSFPHFKVLESIEYKELFARKEPAIPSFGIRIQSALDNSNILNENVHDTRIPEVPPWTLDS